MPQRQNETQAIRNLQRYLRKLSYEEGSIPRPPVDGVFASDTQNAVRAFQRLMGLEETGIADYRTWELLYAAYRASLARNTQPRPILLFPRMPQDHILAAESEGAAVMALQYMLTELSADHTLPPQLMPTGVYDRETADAVSIFQRAHGLPQTGEVDRETWNTLADRYNTFFSRYSKE